MAFQKFIGPYVISMPLRQSGDVLASWHHKAIQLQDRLPTSLRDMNNPNKDDVVLRDPSGANPPVWILPSKMLGLLHQSEFRVVKKVYRDRGKFQEGGAYVQESAHRIRDSLGEFLEGNRVVS